MFSARTAWDRTANLLSVRLETLVRRGVELVDLTASNPSACGLGHDAARLQAVLAGLPLGSYHPDPMGLLTARRAVSDALARLGGRVDPGQVVLTSSTSESYGRLFQLLCDPGDSVLIPEPSYPLLEYLAELASVELRPYPLPLDPFASLDLQAMAAAADETTRAVVVVSPANPTGWVLGPESHRPLDALCATSGWAMVVDEVFVEFPVRGRSPSSVTALAPEALTFALQGLSKSAGLPGWKLAWTAVLGPAPDRDEALARLELMADAYLAVAEPAQLALPRLLVAAPAWRARVMARLEENLRTLHARRPSTAPWDVLHSGGGWSAVVQLPHTADEVEVCLALLEAGVRVQPGHFYDFPRGRYLVLSLLPEPVAFERGADRLQHTLQRLF